MFALSVFRYASSFCRAGPQPADIFWGENECNLHYFRSEHYCNLLLYQTIKHVFETFGDRQYLGCFPFGCVPAAAGYNDIRGCSSVDARNLWAVAKAGDRLSDTSWKTRES